MSDDAGKPSFLDELKRRRVFRVAAVYAVVGWLLIQIGEATFEALELPEGSLRILIIAVAVGFPIAVVLAWIFDLTRTGRRIGFAFVGALVVVLGIVLWMSREEPTATQLQIDLAEIFPAENPPLPDKPSIVVLPFDNLSDDPEQRYFPDGITVDLTNDLASVPSLFVIAPETANSFLDEPVDVVGRELGVRYVVTGSVQRAGDRVRVTSQLVDAQTGVHLWSRRYDREMTDLFEVQSEIVEAILNALPMRIQDAEIERIRHRPTASLTAYESVLRGRALINRARRDDLERARGMFERAIELDSAYVDAYASLAGSYLAEVGNGWGVDEEAIDQAKRYAQRAVELGPGSASAHAALAGVYSFEGRTEEGLTEARRAVELAPNDALALIWLAQAQGRTGQPLAALQSIKRSLRLNPRTSLSIVGALHQLAGQTEEAVALWKRATASNPDDVTSRLLLIEHYGNSGRPSEAAAHAQEVLAVNPGWTVEAAMRRMRQRMRRMSPEEDARLVEIYQQAGFPDETQPRITTEQPNRPSLIVLPFDNLSGDPEQDYFADGITEDLTTALSRSQRLITVLSPRMAQALEGVDTSPQRLQEEFGVLYVVEGSIRRGGERIRVSVRLTDASTGSLVWSESYDRELRRPFDLLNLQSDIVNAALGRLNIEIFEAEHVRPTENLTAYEAYIKARGLVRRSSARPEMLAEARRLAKRAMRLDPEFGEAHATLAMTYIVEDTIRGLTDLSFIDQAQSAADHALTLDPYSAAAHAALANVLRRRGQYEEGLVAAERAIELSPSLDGPYLAMGTIQLRLKQWEEARESLEKLLELNPNPAFPVWAFLGCSYSHLGEIGKGVELFERARSANASGLPELWLIHHYERTGSHAKAVEIAGVLMEEQPDLTAEVATARQQKTPCPVGFPDQLVANLRSAGLP